MMDNNYYLLLPGTWLCCEPDTIIIMPLNIGDNHIKQKLKWVKNQQTNKQTNKQTKQTNNQ